MTDAEKPNGPLFGMWDFPPINILSDRLFRTMDFSRVAQLFQTGKLYFAHPSTWEDPYESKVMHPDSRKLFAQCWSDVRESDAMWRIYSPNHLGVRMGSSATKLRRLVENSVISQGCRFFLREVEYVDYFALRLRLDKHIRALRENYNLDDALEILCTKRDPFAHEAEWRAVVYCPHNSGNVSGVEMEVDPHELIDSITFDPRASHQIVDAFTLYFRQTLQFKGQIGQSALYDKGITYEFDTTQSGEPVSP